MSQNSYSNQILDENAILEWDELDVVSISNNGQLIFYSSRNLKDKCNGYLVNTSGRALSRFDECVDHAVFSKDNRWLYVKSDDELTIIDLKDFHQSEYAKSVTDFQLIEVDNREIVMLYKAQERRLLLFDEGKQKIADFDSVESFKIGKNANVVYIIKKWKSNLKMELDIFQLRMNKVFKVWEGNGLNIESFSINNTGNAYAFTIRNNDSSHYVQSLKYGDITTSQEDYIMTKTFEIESRGIHELKISDSGYNIFFKVDETAYSAKIIDPQLANVSIWNYKDSIPKWEEFLSPGEKVKQYCFSKTTGRVLELASAKYSNPQIQSQGDYVLLLPDKKKPWFTSYLEQYSFSYLNLNSGEVNDFAFPSSSIEYLGQTNNAEYSIWYNYDSLAMFSYEARTNQLRNISKEIPFVLHDSEALKKGRKGIWGIAGWLSENNSVLVYDEFDIWKISLQLTSKPTNITQGFGRARGITLNVEGEDNDLAIGEHVVITAYDRRSKKGGYWKYTIGGRPSFHLDNLNSYGVTTRKPIGIFWGTESKIYKARNTEKYLVVKANASESPNVYFTSDFKHYNKISSIHPEKKYNWLSSELITWKTKNGKVSQGILYKPQDFDSTRKYPVIFNYYEKRSDELYKFIRPEYSRHNLNIPLFVNTGYLIFVPDVDSTPGNNGEGTINSIESAASYLSKMSFIDSTRLGLQGHSYGGWQTNYIIGHSKLFAAACAASGASDLVSGYGQISLDGKGYDRQNFYELRSQGSPYGYGVTPWNSSDLYIKNSPIFFIDRVCTPLLLMHGDKDPSVPFNQGIEMFTAMRRANKKVWLLHYPQAYHQLAGKNSLDYHTRMLQFFNHYLKDASPPIWMTKGVSFHESKTNSGLELDMTGIEP